MRIAEVEVDRAAFSLDGVDWSTAGESMVKIRSELGVDPRGGGTA